MSGPRDDRGEDAFDDFFGDPSPSGRMRPTPATGGASGADRPAVHPDDEPTQDVDLRRRRDEPTQASAPAPVIRPEPTPAGALPETWWQPDAEPAVTTARSSTWQATPAQHQHPDPHPMRTDRPPRRGLTPLTMAGVLVGGVLLGGLCVGGGVMALGQDEPVAQSTTVTETGTAPPTTSSTTTPTTSSTSSSSSSTTSTPPKRSGKAPSGVKTCDGPRQGVAVGRGTDVTSCAFASAVRESYLREKPASGSVDLEVRSPVTKKSYTMTCTGATVTRCTGGNDAVVVLY